MLINKKMNAILTQLDRLILKDYRRTLKINSCIILALFAISSSFFFSSIENQGPSLLWSLLWSFSILAVGVAGLLLYKTTNPSYMKGLIALNFYLLVFSIFRLLTYFVVLWYYYSYLSGYRLNYSLKVIYYGFCAFIAFIGVMASKEPFRSAALLERDLFQDTQNRSASAMGFPLFSISSTSEQIGQPLINTQNYYRASNNSQAAPGSINQMTDSSGL
ncbi:unnamed protein product [Blepharisma stoltei]|uniref:Uncharacterized protein n=1 Tax=Blepharisma stoltei TaxID=1481888 RepID=A0AAU9IV07_9CILI|nr:unnamed protein product [Blepharisma stoltei]